MSTILQDYIKIKETANDHMKNLIEISFRRMNNIDNVIPEYADVETVGAYLFDVLKIKVDDVLEFDHNSNKEKKQILLRDGLDLNKYLNNFPDTFKGYQISIEKLTHTKTKVLFRNVPLIALT